MIELLAYGVKVQGQMVVEKYGTEHDFGFDIFGCHSINHYHNSS